jgi:hypothetical protein
MAHALRPVNLDFIDAAPVRFDFTAPVTAPRDEVFRRISGDPGLWSAWFPGLTEGGYDGDAPPGVGSRRWVAMGDTRYRETILAWDAPARWTYRLDESTDDTLSALVEDWRVEADGDRSIVHWTVTIDPRPDIADSFAQAEGTIGEVFHQAMTNLGNWLSMDGRQLGPIGTEVIYEDDRVRLWRLELAPGERSAVHRHELDNILIMISGDRIAAIPEPDTQGEYPGFVAADIFPFMVVPVKKGGVETAVNVGKEPYREVIVELKGT